MKSLTILTNIIEELPKFDFIDELPKNLSKREKRFSDYKISDNLKILRDNLGINDLSFLLFDSLSSVVPYNKEKTEEYLEKHLNNTTVIEVKDRYFENKLIEAIR